ncbi:MAG: SIS domain-containing protein, partial [Propionibacteriaceae bacterium]|nr:SIS domain-containing protein [Propionibacteriaceae bacterium]
AIIDETTPVFVVVPPVGAGQLHEKVVSNIQEVRARGARTVVLAERGDVSVAPYADYLLELPSTPVLLQPLTATVPLQLFACELATLLGNDVDQPRNLAKSVTVE